MHFIKRYQWLPLDRSILRMNFSLVRKKFSCEVHCSVRSVGESPVLVVVVLVTRWQIEMIPVSPDALNSRFVDNTDGLDFKV